MTAVVSELGAAVRGHISGGNRLMPGFHHSVAVLP